MNPNTVTSKDPALNRDTLVVTLSEPLKTADFKEILKFGNCGDYGHAKTIVAIEQPSNPAGDPNTYVVIIDNTTGVNPTR